LQVSVFKVRSLSFVDYTLQPVSRRVVNFHSTASPSFEWQSELPRLLLRDKSEPIHCVKSVAFKWNDDDEKCWTSQLW